MTTTRKKRGRGLPPLTTWAADWPIVKRHGSPYYVKRVGGYEARVRGDGPPGGPFFYWWAVYRDHRSRETLAMSPKPLDTLQGAQKAAEAALAHFAAQHAPN